MYHSISMTKVTATLAECMGVEPPHAADCAIPVVTKMAEARLGGKADRLFLYHPDALGMWLFQKYTEDFQAVQEKTDLALPMYTVLPSVTPVCFGTMYTGAMPFVHGIQKYEKKRIETDSLFDALIRAGKKVAVVAVEHSSLAVIFDGRDMDYYRLPYDEQVNEKAMELIEEDRHDVILVYNQEYDDAMHATNPESADSLNAMRNHIHAFSKLTTAISEQWERHNTVVCCLTDHGIHSNEEGFGTHGSPLEEDLNIMHFYGFYPCKAVNSR